MKPTKNRLFCASSQRIKMLFPTQEKADNFIRFNADNIAEENEFTPVRSYYCPSCGGWHVTHHSNDRKYKHADNLQNKIFNLANFVNKLKKKFSIIRVIVDFSFVALGFLMGGIFGIGTLVCAFLVGPVAGIFLPINERLIEKVLKALGV